MVNTKPFNLKKADASSGTGPEGYDGYEQGSGFADRQNEQMFTADGAVSPFQAGDKVRLRAGGLTYNAPVGRVVRIHNNQVEVKWETGRHEGKIVKFDLTDTVRLSLTLEKIH
jgi:hypothetical protein